MPIKLLDDILINKIAAGEVVERPASIVKELVENAIDAGAGKIEVNIEQGGIDRIEVEDDGLGIAPDELLLAFQRHATSKISQENDLAYIATMGFRGEALPSIASVSKIEVFTAQSDGKGMQARIEGGTLLHTTPAACPRGTRIIVSDIFYNTPARRQFLKTPVTEGNNVHDIMTKLALSRPDISFKFSSQHKTYFKTPGRGNLLDTVLSIYGQDFCRNLLPVEYQGDNYSLSGLVSSPELTRINRKNQLFFVNTRAIRSPLLYRAIDQAYRGLLVSREFPAALLFLTMPAGEVDVNVHPQKTEIRFRDEKAIFRLVVDVIRDQLNQLDYRFDFREQPAAICESERSPEPMTQPRPELSHGFLYFDQKTSAGSASSAMISPAPHAREIPKEMESASWQQEYKIVGQYLNAYILVEKNEELLLVDQHAAHERINYERLKSKADTANDLAQNLGFPISLHLPVKSLQAVEKKITTLAELGFSLDMIGPEEVVLRSAPWAARGREVEVFSEILQLFEEGRTADPLDESYKLMACKKSIKAGEVLTYAEMETLMAELFQLHDYKHCPHGRPTLLSITRAEMDRHFKRI